MFKSFWGFFVDLVDLACLYLVKMQGKKYDVS